MCGRELDGAGVPEPSPDVARDEPRCPDCDHRATAHGATGRVGDECVGAVADGWCRCRRTRAGIEAES